MESQGLAYKQAEMPTAENQSSITLQQVIEMLLQGITPSKLIQQGVPVELITQAINLLKAQQEAQDEPQQPPVEEAIPEVAPESSEIPVEAGLAAKSYGKNQ